MMQGVLIRGSLGYTITLVQQALKRGVGVTGWRIALAGLTEVTVCAKGRGGSFFLDDGPTPEEHHSSLSPI